MRLTPFLSALATLSVSVVPTARAQQVDSVYKGSVLERITAHDDTSYHFAVYIPRGYAAEHPAPLLLVLDPEGRAAESIRRFVPAAERLGWVVMSSYDTRSDHATRPNARAANLMIADAFRTFHVDTSRLYIAGFAGMAREAWAFAYGSSGHIAGVISAGATMPADTSWRRRYGGRPPFDVALVSGDSSFAYDEMLGTADTLARVGAPIRTAQFPGEHAWPPEAVAAQAMGWLEARAMARHLRAADSTFIDSVFAIDSAAAGALETHHPGAAAAQWERVALAWNGTHDVHAAVARAKALEARPGVNAWRSEHDSLVRETAAFEFELGQELTALRRHPGVPDLRRLNDALRIVQFERWSSDRSDSVRANWAVRRLSEIFMQTSYYEPEAYIAVRDAPRALALLAIAEELRHGSPRICLERSRADALNHDTDLTIEDLRCAMKGGLITLDEIVADPHYVFMHGHDEFNDLLQGKGG